MTDGRLVLLVPGPVPGGEDHTGVDAAGLLWELRHVAGVPVSAVLTRPGAEPGAHGTAAVDTRTAVDTDTDTEAGTADAGAAAGIDAEAGAAPGTDVAAGGGWQPGTATGVVPKGGPVGSIVELAVTGIFSAATVAAVARVATAFVRRGAARKIVLRDGRRSLAITDPSAETERAVRDWLADPERGRTDAGSGAD